MENNQRFITKEAREAAIKQWQLRLVGSPEINDMSDPDIAEKIKYVDERCRSRWSRMNKTADAPILWGDAPPVESDQLSKQFGGIYEMALGWGTYGSEFYQNEELLRDILFGLEWMYKNMYGEAEMRNEGWRDIYACNWWYWFIGAPEYFTDTYIIIADHLSVEDIKRYTALYEFLRNDPKSPVRSTTIKIEAKLAILLSDNEKLKWCDNSYDTALEVTEYGKVRKDFTHWWHNFPHNMTYGVGQNLDRPLFVASVLAGTPIALSSPKKYNQFLMIKYMFEPAIFDGRAFIMLSGRQTHPSEISHGAKAIALTIAMLGVYGKEEDDYIKKFIKRNSKNPQVVKMIKKAAVLYDIAAYKAILADDSIPADEPYEYTHAWYTGDRAVQHRAGYAIGIAMSSSREVAYESILGLNKKGWHTADGATFLYTSYDNGAFDGDNFTNKNTDLAYHIPGTTEDQQPREIRSINNSHSWKSPSDFAGSMVVDGDGLIAAMDFVAMHYEGEDNVEDRGYGGGLAPHNNDLRARKSWFCLDGEIICLGAGITSTTGSPVNTTLEHKRIVGDGGIFIGEKKLPDIPFVYESVGESFLMEGHAAYVILDGKRSLVRRYVCPMAKGQHFVEYRICHGKNPTGATYAYAILPYSTAEAVRDYEKNRKTRIIENTENCQAVSDGKGNGLFVFYTKAASSGIFACDPCIVSVTDIGDGWKIRVCDPTHKNEKVTLVLDAKMKLKEESQRFSVSVVGEKTEITVDMTSAYGESYDAVLEYEGENK